MTDTMVQGGPTNNEPFGGLSVLPRSSETERSAGWCVPAVPLRSVRTATPSVGGQRSPTSPVSNWRASSETSAGVPAVAWVRPVHPSQPGPHHQVQSRGPPAGRGAHLDRRRSPARSVVRRDRGAPGRRPSRRRQYLHQLVLGHNADHVNGNGLDNRRENLRPATAGQQAANKRKRRDATSSIYKGLSRTPTGRWAVLCGPASTNRYVGTFDNEIDAARAYDRRARQVFGEFARLNFEEACR